MQDIFRINHVALSEEDKKIITDIKLRAEHLLGSITSNSPPSREISLAITKLEESVMWAVKGITAKYYSEDKPA